MRIANAIVLLLIAAFFPKTAATYVNSFTPRLQEDVEISREDKLFVNALNNRIDVLLSQEYSKYYEPYSVIKIREYRIKEELDETAKKSDTAQNYLKLKKGEEQEIKQKMTHASGAEQIDRLTRQLEIVQGDRKKAENEASALREKTTNLNDLLRAHRAMHFAEEKNLKAQAERVNNQKMELFYKRSDWELHNTYKHYVAFKNYLMKLAATMALMCNVSIQSERDSAETKGATIKYQTPEQRQFGRGLTPSYTAKCLTACSEQMKPSRYYIWIERGNRPTSDPEQLYVITAESQTVKIQESPQP